MPSAIKMRADSVSPRKTRQCSAFEPNALVSLMSVNLTYSKSQLSRTLSRIARTSGFIGASSLRLDGVSGAIEFSLWCSWSCPRQFPREVRERKRIKKGSELNGAKIREFWDGCD